MVKTVGWVALVGIALTVGTGWPLPARGQACQDEVRAGEKFLADLEQEINEAREQNRPRIRVFMDGGRRLLDEARIECDKAEGKLDRAAALAKVALAQGHFAAARIFIKLD
jgi:hypothetical protein